MATATVTSITSEVPTQADRMPARAALRDGKVGEEIPAEACRAVAHQVEEQHRQRQQRGEQDQHAQQHEQPVDAACAAAPARMQVRADDVGRGDHQYTSRKRRVSTKPAILNTSVVSISTRPAAKIDW